MHKNYFTVKFDGQEKTASDLVVTEREPVNTFPGGPASLTIEADFNDAKISNIVLAIFSPPYEGTYYADVNASKSLGLSATSVDNTSSDYHGTPTSFLTVEEHDYINKRIKGTFELDLVNDQNDTLKLTDGRFDIIYE